VLDGGMGGEKCGFADGNTDGQQGTADPNLQLMVGGQSKWKVEWKPDVWHNIAYEIVRVFAD
jgi:hypothetical protein